MPQPSSESLIVRLEVFFEGAPETGGHGGTRADVLPSEDRKATVRQVEEIEDLFVDRLGRRGEVTDIYYMNAVAAE